MAAINYAKEYQRELEQAFPYALYFGALFNTPNNGRFRWVNAKTIEIPSIQVSGRVDSSRDTLGTASRNYDNSWMPLTLQNERKWSTLVHPRDVQETNQTATIANITRVFNEEQKFPEMDAYCVSKVYADWIANGGVAKTGTLDATTILGIFDAMLEDMAEARVPMIGTICYATPGTKTLLKNAQGITRTLDVATRNALNRAITALDEIEIVEVPSDMMKTLYDFTTGWAVAPTAQQINFMLVNPLAVITPVSYEFAKLDAPTAMSEGKYVYYEESHEDVFVLPKKNAAIAMHIS